MKNDKLLIISAVFSLVEPSSAQTSLRFEHLSVPQGLSNPGVGCALRDQEGFMWFGTRNGLNRYDGKQVLTLRHEVANPSHTLPHNWIFDLLEDRHGRLWVSTAGGLCRLDKRTGGVTPYRIPLKAVGWNSGTQLLEDHEGMIWMGTRRGLARLDPRTARFVCYSLSPDAREVKCLSEDEKGRIWLGTGRGLYRFDRASKRFCPHPIQYRTSVAPNTVALCFDTEKRLWVGTEGDGLFYLDTRLENPTALRYECDGQIQKTIQYQGIFKSGDTLWLGTNRGLQRVELSTQTVTSFRLDLQDPNSLSSDNVMQIVGYGNNLLWVCTGLGINKVNLSPPKFRSYQFIPTLANTSTPLNRIEAVGSDTSGLLWLGTETQGLYRLTPGTGRFEHLPLLSVTTGGASSNRIMSLLCDHSGRIWAGTPEALHQFDPATGRLLRRIPSRLQVNYLAEDAGGRVWLAGNGGIGVLSASGSDSIRYYTGSAYFQDYYVDDLLLSRSGEVWVAMGYGGITRFDPRSGRVRKYLRPHRYLQAGSLNDHSVRTLFEDEAGYIWAGTNQGGLNRYNPRTDRFDYLTTRQGLPSNYVASVSTGSDGLLWIGTDNGLCRYDSNARLCHNFGLSDGLPSGTFVDGCVHRRGDFLFFGTDNGLVVVNTRQIRLNSARPPVRIASLRVLNQPHELPAEVLELRHDQNLISVDFAALDYESAEKNQYAYQLIGLHPDWVYSGTQRSADFSNLAPGSYLLRVKASNNDGLWNERGTSLRIVIHPPWWRTWWVYLGYVLTGAGAIWGLIRYQSERVREQQLLRFGQQETERLQEIDEIKNRFFSNLTHEFRTPLTLISSPLERLLDTEQFSPSTQRKLTTIQRNANHLLRLVNQLLDLTQLTEGRVKLTETPGDFTYFVGHVIDLFRPEAESKEIQIFFSENSPAFEVYFDVEKWEKILINLLGNSLKFTPVGGQIRVSLVARSEHQSYLVAQLVVADSGIGIPPEKLPFIFDRFYQADDSPTRAFGGTGIGLALVKELIDRIGGRIDVRSQESSGTTVTLQVPLRRAPAHLVILPRPAPGSETLPARLSPPLPTDPPQAAPGEAPLLLLVDDNEELRGFLSEELSGAYRLLSAENGQIALDIARQELPDLVVSDVMMPVMDGYALTRLLKTDPLTAHIGVVLLTARTAREGLIEGLELGADAYLTKPFHLDELVLRLDNLLDRRERLRRYYQQQLRQPQPKGPDPAAPAPDPWLEKLQELVEQHLGDSAFGTEALASALNMSRRTLHRKTTALLGLGPNDYLRQYRLKRAAALLGEGRSVGELAFLVGYESQTHFSGVFKEFYGMSPSEYLRQGSRGGQ